ncbi:MAG TPA: type II toxin-antitoxin system HipA family toxin [Woeseiaceae bacterium]|nr:type II toxin-antitoxin system HipA family toxin [Woeseiaceae bacterium]
MVERVETAEVRLWQQLVGAVSWLNDRGYAVFEFDPDFVKTGLDISPIHMPLSGARSGDGLYAFPELARRTYLGLPGLLADALPDKYGRSVIDAWLARQGRDPESFSPVERLCYTASRAMGALEFAPPVMKRKEKAHPIEIAELVDLAQAIVNERQGLAVQLGGSEIEDAEAIQEILSVGTSAGGARPKAIIALNDQGKVLSGQADVPPGYDYWILKFDGVTDLELGEPAEYGRIEYAYYEMARIAGINMMECRLLEENGRAHFLTRRFDRVDGQKIHMQSLCGIAHFDFNESGLYSYEQAFSIMRKLRLNKKEAAEQFRRMVFNVVARNLDDHTKNIAFLMDAKGRWTLSPAFDLTYAHNPAGKWTSQHQMSINGKRDNLMRDDLLTVGKSISLSKPEVIVDEVIDAVAQWPHLSKNAGVSPLKRRDRAKNHRLDLR